MSNTAKLFWCNLHRIRNEKGLTASALELNLGIPTGRFKQTQRTTNNTQANQNSANQTRDPFGGSSIDVTDDLPF